MNSSHPTHHFKVGQRVQIAGKHLEGRIAYIGATNFAPGKWIGVALDKERGKNNGTVKGIFYFKCPPNYGIFVRPTQLIMKKFNVIEEVNSGMEQVKTKESSPKRMQTATAAGSAAIAAIAAAATQALAENVEVVTPKKVPKQPTSTNLLKTTKINQPKEVTPLQSSASQVSLVPTVVPGPCRSLRPPPALAPKRSKTSMSPSETFCCGKRSSFVETGFLEILRPQFTPGQPLRSPTFSTMMLNSSASNLHDLKQQNRQLEARIVELNKEIEVLKSHKAEDIRKLQDMERLRLQNEQLVEFKARIMDQQNNLQRELQRLRQDLREANEQKTKYQRDLDEAGENIELLTLDKEMAEEKAETLQLELEMSQEQNEELCLDVEILKAENERLLLGSDNNIISKEEQNNSVGEIRKLEQYNQRLKETVIKLRDVLTLEKQQSLKAFKELETNSSEILELRKNKELLTQRCDVMESHIIDLREQVDAALGAETMVTNLANAKLELEERVRLLEEEVNELEALEEIHEQLIESNQDLERDLREELESLNTNIRTLQQEKDTALETVYERDCTIMKFRTLVKTLNEREQLREQVNLTTQASTTATVSTSEELNSISSNPEFMPGVDFQQVFASTKAYGRALELQLSAVDLKMLQLQIEYLKAFLPEELLLRGAAYDVILILILLQRCMEKIDIICSGIHEKFPASCEFGRDAIFEGYSVHRFAFRTRCLYLLRSLKMILLQLEFALNHCDYEICTHAAIYRGEMESQEKQLDDLLKLLKKGLLDENSPVGGLERSASFFNMLLNNLFSNQNLGELLDEQKLYVSLIEVYDVALDCVNTHAGLLYTIIQLGDEETDSFCSMQFLMEHVRSFKMQLKQLQRKLPTKSVSYSTLQWPQLQRLHERNDHLGKLIELLSCTAREATKDIANSSKTHNSNEVAIDHERLWRIVNLNCNKLAPEAFQRAPVEFFHNSIVILQEQLEEFQQFIKESEQSLTINLNTLYVRSNEVTILQQAGEMKKHYDETKQLQHLLNDKEKEIKSLKYLAKMKQNDFSEIQIRKDMAEKNLQKQQQEQEQLLHLVADRMEELLEGLQQQQIKLIHSLQNNNDKLLLLEKSQENLKLCLASNTQTLNSCSHEAFKEIEGLTQCIRHYRQENIALQAKYLKTEFLKMDPLHVPQRVLQTQQQAEIQHLAEELNLVKKSWLMGYLALPKASAKTQVKLETQQLSAHIMDMYYKTHPHRRIQTDFGQFFTPEAKQLLQ